MIGSLDREASDRDLIRTEPDRLMRRCLEADSVFGLRVPMNPRPCFHLWNPLCRQAAAMLLAASMASAADPPPAAGSQGTAYRLFQVPPDFVVRGPDADQPGREPRRVDFIVPALGHTAPVDGRPVMESLGVTFREGDVALIAKLAHTTVLFVRAEPDQVDLVETLCDQIIGSGPPSHGLITWRLQRLAPGAAAEDLLIRSVTCRAGQRVKFLRHVHGREVESDEAELTIGEDGVTIDINSAVKLHVGDTVIRATGQALVRTDDPQPLVLYRTPEKPGGATLELSLSAKRLPLPPDAGSGPAGPLSSGLQALAVIVNEQVLAVHSGQQIRQRDLVWLPEFYPAAEGSEDSTPDSPRLKPVRVKLPLIGETDLVDVRNELRKRNIPLKDGDRAWWSPATKLLWIEAGPRAVAEAAGLSGADWWLQSGVTQLEVQFDSWQENPQREELGSRLVLLRGGQRASGSLSAAKGKGEQVEVEGWAEGPASVADVNYSLTKWRMGGETWTLNGMALTASDGTLPFPVASGMAKDNGGAMKHITITANRRLNAWLKLLSSPERKAAAISEIGTALDAAGAK